jgi:hypothetical protein
LQTVDAERRTERTVEVFITIGDEVGQSSGTLSRSMEQQSASDMTLLLQHAEKNSLIACNTSLLHTED